MRDLTCGQCQRAMGAYLDSEMGRDELAEVEVHLESCAACRRALDAEREVRDLVRSRREDLMKRPAPDLRPRVLAAVRAAHAQGLRANATPRPRLALYAVAASIALVALGWFYGRHAGTATPGTVVAELVNEHIRCMMKREAALDVTTGDVDSLRGWFRGRLDANVEVPDFRDQGLDVAGGRLCYLLDRRAAYVMYRAEGAHLVCMFVLDAGGLADETSEGGSDTLPGVVLTAWKGYTVAVWQDRGLLHALVSDVPAATLEKLAAATRRT